MTSAQSVDVTPGLTADPVILSIGISGSSIGGLMTVLSRKLSSLASLSTDNSTALALAGWTFSGTSSSSCQRPENFVNGY